MAESDNTRIRMAARFIGIAIEELGSMWLSNVAQFEDFIGYAEFTARTRKYGAG